MESPNTSSHTIELNPNCSGQPHSNRPGTVPGYENKDLECILAILCVPFMVCPLRSANAQSGKVILKIPLSWHKWTSRFYSLGEHLRTQLKDHTRYDQGPGIHSKPRRVSLPVGEAQLAGCLKV